MTEAPKGDAAPSQEPSPALAPTPTDGFARLVAGLEAALGWVLIGLVAALVLDVSWQVASRYLLGAPSSWTEELASFLMIWTGLLGAATALSRRAHVGVDVLTARLSPRAKARVDALSALIVALFAALVLGLGGGRLVLRTWALGQISPALQLPMGAVYLALPLSGLCMTLIALQQSREALARPQPPEA